MTTRSRVTSRLRAVPAMEGHAHNQIILTSKCGAKTHRRVVAAIHPGVTPRGSQRTKSVARGWRCVHTQLSASRHHTNSALISVHASPHEITGESRPIPLSRNCPKQCTTCCGGNLAKSSFTHTCNPSGSHIFRRRGLRSTGCWRRSARGRTRHQQPSRWDCRCLRACG